jgi:hypothetical protein
MPIELADMSRTALLWILWISLTAPIALGVLAIVVYGGNRSFLLIGRTTDGHHQIELACDACHVSAFGGPELLQQSCVDCHGAALKTENDAHPKSKFTDPRNADRTALLDARYCVTCHQEHRPKITHAMGVTLPDDYCFTCHRDIADDRPSHKGLKFTTCASAGCHNFHDNRALYADFLTLHQGEPAVLAEQRVALSEYLAQKEVRSRAARPLGVSDADPPPGYGREPIVIAWANEAHARNGINCTGCHATKANPAHWIEKPTLSACAECHDDQARTFSEGKHGMRLRPGLVAAGDGWLGMFRQSPLTPMTPAHARLPMKADAADTTLGCNTCHAAHDFDLARAQVTACAGCHDDPHTRAYFDSPHYELFKKELAGELQHGAGVSCASCHMPVIETRREDGSKANFITHNQNDNLRPNEKMVRSVCGNCHGLQFTLDALADRDLVERNFTGNPAMHVESIDWARRRKQEREAARQ